jgi:hypothetical protein
MIAVGRADLDGLQAQVTSVQDIQQNNEYNKGVVDRWYGVEMGPSVIVDVPSECIVGEGLSELQSSMAQVQHGLMDESAGFVTAAEVKKDSTAAEVKKDSNQPRRMCVMSEPELRGKVTFLPPFF